MNVWNLNPPLENSGRAFVNARVPRPQPHLVHVLQVCLAVFALWLALPFAAWFPAHASTLVVDNQAGALYDAVLDGYPGIAEFDGSPEFAGYRPVVALKLGVVEGRTVVEFPLRGLIGATARGARLEWNIDDVLSTFGPGTSFSGRAARVLLVHPYAGDGVLTLSDFNSTASEPWTVSTESFGAITDQTLARTGPLVFSVDVTPVLIDLLSNGANWLGVVFRTTDNNTATSIDNLGDQPGYGGDVTPLPNAFLPRLVIDIEDPPPAPTLTPTPSTTPSVTATATVTPTLPESATPTPTKTVSCPGDCSEDGQVTVDEVIQLVRIALDLGPMDLCPVGDRNDDETVTIDEILQAVTAALSGCGAVHTLEQ